MEPEFYAGREQTFVKHFILQKYLERFALIVGFHWQTLTYVDCFSGPWNVRSDDLADSSFAIALQELRKAKATHAKLHSIRLRCFFLEKDPVAYSRLKAFADAATDAEVETKNAILEESIPAIVDFVKGGGSNSFPFILIDPKGWTGFALETIEPLLQLNPGEVLINFMTSHIRRFIDSPQEETQDSFRRLFGSDAFRERVHGLTLQDREDAAVDEYCKSVKVSGRFAFTCSAIVLDPEVDRTHFHLIYATRSSKGVEVFKNAERKAMEAQEDARADAQQRLRQSRTGQGALFSGHELHDPSYYNSLRERYLDKSKKLVLERLQMAGRALYDDIWAIALSQPMTWDSDLKAWIKEWHDGGRGHLKFEGMKQRQKVPHREEDNYLIWN